MEFASSLPKLQEEPSAGESVLILVLGVSEKLPHRRANPRERHYTEYYNGHTRDVIANKFRVDIEHFGYEFGG